MKNNYKLRRRNKYNSSNQTEMVFLLERRSQNQESGFPVVWSFQDCFHGVGLSQSLPALPEADGVRREDRARHLAQEDDDGRDRDAQNQPCAGRTESKFFLKTFLVDYWG